MTYSNFCGSLRSVFTGAALASALLLPASARASGAPTVHVHVTSPKPVELERRADDGPGAWETACASPCDRELPTSGEYRVAFGKAEKPGEPFRLDPAIRGAVVLKVQPPSPSTKTAGTVIVVLGSAVAGAGLVGVVWSGSLLLGAPDCGSESAGDWCGLGRAIGAFFLVVSGAALLAGTGVILGGASMIADADASTSQRPVATREPTWSAPRAEAPSKAAFVTPFSFSF